MPNFNYKAIDSNGKLIKGSLHAHSQDELNERLAKQGLAPVEVKQSHNRSSNAKEPATSADNSSLIARLISKKSISTRDLLLFTKQMATMVKVGIPITQALEIIHNQTTDQFFRKVVGKVVEEIKAGSSLSKAMASHPKVFSMLYRSVVQAGELSGALPKVLDRLLYLIEHEAKIKSEINTAMRYPMMVVFALVVTFVIMLSFVIPRFVGFFEGSDLVLPLPTRMCIALSNFMVDYSVLLVAAVIMLVFGVRWAWKNAGTRLQIDRLILGMPIIREVMIKASMSRFASVFAILQANGVMILETLGILRNIIGNSAIAAEFEQIQESLKSGQGISGPLRRGRYFPPLFVNMIAIGEETGRLDEMLREVSDHYDTEVNMTIKKMTDAIGPILIVTLTGIVAFFALAIYMPMWELSQMAQQ
ncbi:MAG: type II secretion system F family protein [Opitutales bacterium]|nr:type II secretion system F family protein [Opitutales bacterium]